LKEPVLELSFAAGIDQSQRAELLDPRAGFLALENMRSPTVGCVGKRDGFNAFTTLSRVDATIRSAGYRMFAHGKQTCVIDRDVLDVSGDPVEEQPPISRGRVPECGLSMMRVPTPGVTGSLTCTDSVRVGDYLALAYTAGQSVYASVVEAETGRVIVPPSLIYTGSAAEIYGLLGARGSTAMLFVVCSGEGEIRLSEADCSTATAAYAGWSSQVATVSDNGGLALAVHSIGSRVYMAYVNDSAGASQLSLEMYDGGAGGSTTINTSSATPSDLGLGGASGDTLWVAWNESTAVKVCGLSTTNLASVLATAATTITAASAPSFNGIAVVASSTAAAGRLFVNDGGGALLYTRNFTTSAGAVSAGGSTATHYNTQMSGRPFRVGSRYYGVCRGYDSQEDVAILCDLTETNAWLRPVANVAPRLANSFFAAQAAQHTTREFWAPIGIQTAGNVTGVQMARFDFDADARWRAVPHNGVTFLSGGLLACFDGTRIFESNFVIRPPAPALATNGAGSFTTSAGGISCVLVYEQVDAAGNWHVSGVSTAVGSGNFSNKVNLAITYRPLGISARISAATDPSVRTSLYATQDGGSTYHYVTSFTNTLTAASFTYNMTAAPDGTGALFMGTGSLPNTGAQLDRRAPQGLPHLCSYNGFLVAAGDEEVRWTGQDVDGEGAWWNDNFSLAVTGGGEITALEAYEGTLFAFKRDRIFAMAGAPPNDSGTEGGLGAPQRLGVSVGARSPFTAVTDLGIFFVSDRGVELLNRNRAVDFIGEKIQDTFDAYPYVSAITYDHASSCVLIEASAGRSAGLPTGNGRTFVYDLKARAWRSFDRRAVSATADVPAADGCMVWNGSAWRYGWLRSNGAAYIETSEHKLDPGDVRVRMYAKTPWIHVAGIQGEQHMDTMYLQGVFVEDHDLEVGIANDYAATFTSETHDSDAIAALTPVYVLNQDIPQKTGQALAVEIEDAAPTGAASNDGTGDAALWIALSFAGMGKSGSKRASSVQRGGSD
jgi:hypothetical protein